MITPCSTNVKRVRRRPSPPSAPLGFTARLSREGIRLTDNTGYKLTFRYKADSLSTAVRVEPMASFWDGNGGNFWVRDENVSVFSGNGYTIGP